VDADAIQAVAEDLLFLRARWGPDLPDAEIRRGCATLRRLLVEGAYGSAWRAVGLQKEPSVVAVDLDGVLDETPPSLVEFALAAGAIFRGVLMASCTLLKSGSPPSKMPGPPLTPDGFPGEQHFTLSRYLSSTAGMVQGRQFTRRDVIKYVANAKGGVHAGPSQHKAELKLIERMAKAERRLRLHQTDGLFVELVAIAQAIGRSADLEVFLSHLPPGVRQRAEQSLHAVAI
jgi:hypothetical protein